MLRACRSFTLAAALCLPALGPACLGQSWRIQFAYEKRNSNLEIRDLKFPSAVRGIAVGVLTEGRSSRPVCLVTSDGGVRWDLRPAPAEGRSLFFLNESVGWMAAPSGIYKTVESGRSWIKLPGGVRGALQVWFADENRGWAVGERKGAYETADGGKTWKRLAVLEQVNSRTDATVFRAIGFADARNGLILGQSIPPQPQAVRRGPWLPEGMAPGRSRRREQPHLMIALETHDGGASWKATTASLLGRAVRIAFLQGGRPLVLFQFLDEFSVPAEVYLLGAPSGTPPRVFSQVGRAVTDLAVSPGGTVYLAAVEPPGSLNWGPVPGKVKVLRSSNLKDWSEMAVDYRALARGAVLAVADESNAWLATDTGMILRLTP